MAFHEVRFPATLSLRSTGGPERRTEIVTLANGFEERNTPWQHSRRRYDAGTGLRSMADLEQLIAFYEERRGQLHGFRWKDWADFSSARFGKDRNFGDQILGVADGTNRTFQLSKTYGLGATAYRRPITKPVAGTVVVAVQGDPIYEGEGFDMDPNTGVVVVRELPVADAVITAGYEFDVPVRFDTDRIDVSMDTFNAGQIPNVPVVEVRV